MHTAQSSRLVEIFFFLDLRTFFFPQRLKLFFFSSPLLLAITFHSSAIHHRRHTPPLQPMSTPWHFTCQLLFVVAKVIHSASVHCSEHLAFVTFPFPRRSCYYFHLSDETFQCRQWLVSPSFYAFFLWQRSAFISFQSSYKPCCSETRCPSPNSEISTGTIHRSLFRPLFLFPHSPPSRRWVYISKATNLNLNRRSRHFTCPLFSLVLAP